MIEPLETRYTPAALISIAGPENPTAEGDANTVTFTITLSEAAAETITVDYATLGMSATADEDFVSQSGTITFDPGQTEQTVTINLREDIAYEGEEQFAVVLTNAVGADIAGDTATAVILDNDPEPTINIQDVSQSEGDEDNVLEFVITLTGPSYQPVSVTVSTSNGTALAGEDYDSISSMVVTFEPGETSKTVQVTIKGDTIEEGDETFTLNLSGAEGAVIGTAQATATITNDDGGSGGPALSISSETKTEDTGVVMVFTVTLNESSADEVTVDWATQDNSAIAGLDYVAASGTLTFAPGETSKTITITLLDDSITEADETFFVNLTNSSNANIDVGQGVGTIVDDDVKPTFTIKAFGQQGTVFSVNEGNNKRQYAVTFQLSNAFDAPVTINIATSGTATAGVDYLDLPDELVFAPGETTKTLMLTVLGDTVDELDETIVLEFSGTNLGDTFPASATITLKNDERLITVSDASVTEGNSGTKQMIFTVNLNQVANHDITFDYATVDGTATAGSDYVSKSGTITILAGQTTAEITIDILGDIAGEFTEFFTIDLSNVQGATINKTSLQGTIVNDDSALSISDAQIIEGGAGTTSAMVFTVRLDRSAEHAGNTVTVNYATSTAPAGSGVATGGTSPTASGVDFINTNGTLTFAPGQTEMTIIVPIVGDGSNEPNETFMVTLSGVTGLGDEESTNAALLDVTATGTIIDDEGLITISDATIVEGDSGTANMVFVVTLLNAGSVNGTVEISYATFDGTAVSTGINPDYMSKTGTLTFSASTTQHTISIPIFGDRIFEGNQTFTVQLTQTNSNVVSIGKATATGTIIDNDAAPVISISGGAVAEGDATGGKVPFTVSLSTTSEVPITVNFATQNGTATAGVDYEATATTLVFYPGDLTQTVWVDIIGDTTVEGNETLKGVISAPSAGTLGVSNADGIIQDDDITVNITGFTITEGNSGSKTATMKVTLSQAPAAGAPVVVNWSVIGGNATLGSDYRMGTTGPLTFTSNGSLEQEIRFTILGDQLNELDEVINVQITSATGAKLGTSTATGTITNDDIVSASIADAVILEGDGTSPKQMVFTVTLSRPSDQTIKLNLGTQEGTATSADFTAKDDTLTFAPGQVTATFTVEILGDTEDEPTETFSVLLEADESNPVPVTIADGSATGTILDNDTRSLSIADAQVAEGNSGTKVMTFTVTLSSAASQEVRVSYFTASRTGAAAATLNEDYLAASGELIFAPGETTKTIEVTIIGDADTIPEGDETFLVNLSNPVNATISDNQAIGTILNDATSFRIEPVVASGNEGTGSGAATVLRFKVIREGVLTGTNTVSYTTVDGTAVSSGAFADFIAKNGTLTFGPGDTEQEITITLRQDANLEDDENFLVRLTGASNAIIQEGQGETTGTILNDDVAPTITVVDASVAEENASSATRQITLKLSAADQTKAIVVNYSLADGTARSATSSPFAIDYGPSSGTITFAPGEISKTFSVTIFGDPTDEEDETFFVNYTAETEGIEFTDGNSQATVTIIDDDAAPTIRFGQVGSGPSNGDINVQEGFGTSGITPRLILSAFSEKEVKVTITAIAGTATAGSDFLVGTPIEITFAPGTTEATGLPQFTILGDSTRELDETFFLKLSNFVNVTPSDDTAVVTIQNDDPLPQLAINSVTLEEGDSGQSEMVFTVSLLGATDQTVTVNYATADGTTGVGSATSSGPAADFIAQSGVLTFAPGETTKTIRVAIIGDTYSELDETFTVKLSGATNAAIAVDTGTGTIENGADSIIGLVIRDAAKTENPTTGDSSKVMNFVVELSRPMATDVTFTAITRNGTAVAGEDFVLVNAQFTIAAGSLTTTVGVTINEDNTFEATESFFVQVSGVSEGVQIQSSEARGTIFNDDVLVIDSKTIKYVDEDGDLVTVKISKGNLLSGVLSFSDVNSIGGRILQLVNFTGNPALFNGTNLSITTEAQDGFAASGYTSDGKVDVGTIRGALVDPLTLQVRQGIDFGSIVVQGDVGKITAGDNLTTPAIRGKIDVQSIGVRGSATQKPGEGDNDLVSTFLSGVNSLKVAGDVLGTIRVIGNEFGDIKSLNIGGALRGTENNTSGVIFFTGTLSSATIGSIIGGNATSTSDTTKFAQNSGSIIGDSNTGANIGTLRILGDLVGGTGTESGRVVAMKIGNVNIGGSIIGGDSGGTTSGGIELGANSGSIFGIRSLGTIKVGGDVVGGTAAQSGIVSTQGGINKIQVGGSIIGGTRDDSGAFLVDKNITNLVVGGNIEGGTGNRSGVVRTLANITNITLGSANVPGSGNLIGGRGIDSGVIAAGSGVLSGVLVSQGGTINKAVIHGDIRGGSGDGTGGILLGGRLANLTINGSLIGGDLLSGPGEPTTTSIERTGFVAAGRIGKLVIEGDVRSGTNPGTGLVDSGNIRAQEDIISIAIRGSIVGTAITPVVIAAGFNASATAPAIGSLTVGKGSGSNVTGGNASYFNLVAGYLQFGTVANPLGTAFNADAKIGKVTFLGDILATNIIAGASEGTDGEFGTGDDTKVVRANGILDNPKIVSSIAKVVARSVLDNDQSYGIVAQQVGSVIIGGSAVELIKGPFNDPPTEVAPGSMMSVVEIDR